MGSPIPCCLLWPEKLQLSGKSLVFMLKYSRYTAEIVKSGKIWKGVPHRKQWPYCDMWSLVRHHTTPSEEASPLTLHLHGASKLRCDRLELWWIIIYLYIKNTRNKNIFRLTVWRDGTTSFKLILPKIATRDPVTEKIFNIKTFFAIFLYSSIRMKLCTSVCNKIFEHKYVFL